MKKTGILGGTFNPIHNGHLILAQNALEQCALDEILFIPSGCSYMKQNVLEAKQRYRMVELAIADNPTFQVSDIEVSRPGYSYTCETLSELTMKNPDTQYYYIVGGDTLFSMEKWYQPDRIFAQCIIICMVRNGYPLAQLHQKRETLVQMYHAQIRFLEEKSFDISSSEIRTRIREQKPVSYFIPEAVQNYIAEHQLYRI